MSRAIYPKLAIDGIRKNKNLYLPFIFTGAVFIMMHYILGYLERCPVVEQMSGGSTLQSILPMGCYVIAAFSAVFLFYTNSLLIKQRNREFGLYNVLGMDKKNIGKIMFFESLTVSAVSIAAGVVFGTLFSKLAELLLINILDKPIDYSLKISFAPMCNTVKAFVNIYLGLLVYSIIRVAFSKPLNLMQSSKAGEKVPKRAWVLAPIGVLFLGVAYYLAVSISDPMTAVALFFVAVLFVIAGTYLLFISGSVVFCKILQKNKKYYYKSNHFVSVSSMVYRMKRNGAGLASICILLTMVLVIISSTACLYFGAEDSVKLRCPNSINLSFTFSEFDGIGTENLETIRNTIKNHSGANADLYGIRSCEIPGIMTEKGIFLDIENPDVYDYSTYRTGYLSVVSLSDYNHLMGDNKSLADGECLIYCSRTTYDADTFAVEYGATYKIKERLKNFKIDGKTLAMTMPVVYLVVDSLDAFAAPLTGIKSESGEPVMKYDWRCGFDVENFDRETEIATALENDIKAVVKKDENRLFQTQWEVFSRNERRENFYSMYGGLFFVGIMLSIVFLIAAVLIIYYKQISEGYEDAARFDIMKKVGMTSKDIKRSINSQILTVFFMPLFFAGVHLGFAFPFVSKILLMFAFNNTALSIAVNIGCFAVFGVFYAAVYKLTSGVYYNIVSKKQ